MSPEFPPSCVADAGEMGFVQLGTISQQTVYALNPHKPSCSVQLAKHFRYNDVRKYFFNNKVVDAWNSLSNNIVLSPSVAIFKKILCTINQDGFVTIL